MPRFGKDRLRSALERMGGFAVDSGASPETLDLLRAYQVGAYDQPAPPVQPQRSASDMSLQDLIAPLLGMMQARAVQGGQNQAQMERLEREAALQAEAGTIERDAAHKLAMDTMTKKAELERADPLNQANTEREQATAAGIRARMAQGDEMAPENRAKILELFRNEQTSLLASINDPNQSPSALSNVEAVGPILVSYAKLVGIPEAQAMAPIYAALKARGIAVPELRPSGGAPPIPQGIQAAALGDQPEPEEELFTEPWQRGLWDDPYIPKIGKIAGSLPAFGLDALRTGGKASGRALKWLFRP